MFTQQNNNYFVCNINGNRKLYKTVSRGSKWNSDTSRHIVKPMVLVNGVYEVKENACPIILVFSKLKGFASQVTDEEIWEIINEESKRTRISEAAKQRDFREMKNYFNEPNCAEVETWHISGETIMTNKLWTPYEDIPTFE